jgi:hypothetical protein
MFNNSDARSCFSAAARQLRNAAGLTQHTGMTFNNPPGTLATTGQSRLMFIALKSRSDMLCNMPAKKLRQLLTRGNFRA